MARTGDWIVACDGRKALILENRGDEKFPNLQLVETFEHADMPSHVMGAAPPGRTFQSAGVRRSSLAQVDLHDEAERSFLRDLASWLNSAVSAGRTKALLMAAPPRALGMIREHYSPVLRDAIKQEITKDVVKLPVYEIERLLLSKTRD